MIDHLDHLVLTTAHEEACIRFYVDVMGMALESFGAGRKAFRFGNQKINLHVKGHEFEPKAQVPMPGSLDLCFIADTSADAIGAHLRACGVEITEGPVAKTGALGPMTSHYCRDPDGNLIEVASYLR